MFNNDTTDNEEDDEEERMQRVACAWLNHDIETPVIDYDNHQVQRQAWADNFPVTVRNQLYIGRFVQIWYVTRNHRFVVLPSSVKSVDGWLVDGRSVDGWSVDGWSVN